MTNELVHPFYEVKEKVKKCKKIENHFSEKMFTIYKRCAIISPS